MGYDASEQVKGRKIQALVDSEGLPMRGAVHSAAIQDRDGAGLVLDKIRRRFTWLDLICAEGVYTPGRFAAVERCRRCVWRSSSGATIRRALSSYRAAGWSTHLLLVRPQSASRQGLREPRRNLSHPRHSGLYPAEPQAARQGVGCGPRYTVTKVGKSDCEGTFDGASGNDDAPIPVVRPALSIA